MDNVKVYLDSIIFRLQVAGGISLYWYELLRGLSSSSCDLHVVKCPGGEKNIYHDKIAGLGTEIVDKNPLPINISRFLPCMQSVRDESVFHSSYFRRSLSRNVANVVTVYDFTYEKFLKSTKRIPHILQKKRALQKADGIICISESTKRDMLDLYADLEEKRVRVIHLGVSESFGMSEGETGDKDLDDFLSQPYVIFIGSRASYKNFHIAVDILSERSNLNLLLVGGGPLSPEESGLLDKKLSGRCKHHQRVDDRLLNIFYSKAFCLLYPSSYEGFGLPLVEAMRAGCPVVSVNASSIPEVCGDAALLSDKINVISLGGEVDRLLDDDFRRQLIVKGLDRSAIFNWDNCVEKTLEFYKELFELKFGNCE